nr:class I SAM-dependent methyltransferase [uncultured Caproiciproducens sp.]
MSYSSFALYYDSLTQNVGYSERADYLIGLFDRMNHKAGLTLDLACGTGSFTIELAKRGIDIYGIDGSESMLSVAKQKAADCGLDILFLRQQMQSIDLYGTVDTAICMLDSINHLTRESDVMKTFSRVSLFLNQGGYFIFDMNTLYKHQHVLGNHTFIYDTDKVYCVWQNNFEEKTSRVSITLDFFGREGSFYNRSSEHFYERAYETKLIISLLSKAGLETVGLFRELSFEKPDDQTERIVVVAKKV